MLLLPVAALGYRVHSRLYRYYSSSANNCYLDWLDFYFFADFLFLSHYHRQWQKREQQQAQESFEYAPVEAISHSSYCYSHYFCGNELKNGDLDHLYPHYYQRNIELRSFGIQQRMVGNDWRKFVCRHYLCYYLDYFHHDYYRCCSSDESYWQLLEYHSHYLCSYCEDNHCPWSEKIKQT